MLVLFVFHNKTTHSILNFMAFSRRFKHVDLYTYDGKQWIGFRFGTDGMTYAFTGHSCLTDLAEQAKQLKETEALVALEVEKGCKFPWRPLSVPICNEFARFIAKIDVGFTWNPRHLYNKLIKYDQLTNFEVFYSWRRPDGRE
jgi:hypothetical protein